MTDTKYGRLVKQLKYEIEEGTDNGDGKTEYTAMFRGSDLEGLNYSICNTTCGVSSRAIGVPESRQTIWFSGNLT